MYTTYQLNSNDLTPEFIDILKATYKDKDIEIAVYNIDATEYLLHSPKNRDVLLERIEDIKNNQNIVTPNQDIFQ
jgi:antitoxin YefM